jgi:cytochrome c oxidase cbb3-type subunit 4
MDAGLLRGLFTVFMVIAFAGVVWWAYSARRKDDFEEAANLPLLDDEIVTVNGSRAGKVHKGADRR